MTGPGVGWGSAGGVALKMKLLDDGMVPTRTQTLVRWMAPLGSPSVRQEDWVRLPSYCVQDTSI